MNALLLEINGAVDDAGGCLDPPSSELYRKRYRKLLAEAETECPAPIKRAKHWKPGKLARSKSRNLLERLKDFEGDVRSASWMTRSSLLPTTRLKTIFG
jgi:transposase